MKAPEERPIVLVIDDTPTNIVLVNSSLRNEYRVRVASNGADGLRAAQTAPLPDVILLDVMMPEMDGYEVCKRLKANPLTERIPVIFLTAKTQIDDEARGLEQGAADYLSKPIHPVILKTRVKMQVRLKTMDDQLRDRNVHLEADIRQRTREISLTQDVTNLAMASLAETRDSDTGNHIRRTQNYIRVLAETLSTEERFKDYLTEATIERIFKSAPLHDIGKVGIPDRILLKPGPLDAEEFEIMKTHTTLGYEAIRNAEKTLGAELPFLREAKEIVLSHQEWWNGSGYPQGLKGDAIPVSARLMALADVYDALISRRVYKEPLPHATAVGIIEKDSGVHFDPDMVRAFLRVADQFKDIAQRYGDSDQDLEGKRQLILAARL